MKLADELHHRTSLAGQGLGAVDNATYFYTKWRLLKLARCGIYRTKSLHLQRCLFVRRGPSTPPSGLSLYRVPWRHLSRLASRWSLDLQIRQRHWTAGLLLLMLLATAAPFNGGGWLVVEELFASP